MNTAELYVEPIIIGFLALVLLTLPYAPEVTALARAENLELPHGVALGAVLIGIAYLVGMLADRLIDTGFEALERHNRVRFACSKLKVDTLPASDLAARKAAWSGKPPEKDLFPEDRRRWWVYSEAERIVDFLDYVRARIRLLRALAFLLPGLFYTGAIGAARLNWWLDCAVPASKSTWCERVNFGLAVPAVADWYFLWAAPAVYALIALVAATLKAGDRIHKVDGAPKAQQNSPPETVIPVPDCQSFIWKRGTAWWHAGSWRPPRTDQDREMRVYAAERGWLADNMASRGLAGDVLWRSPFFWFAAGLLLASMPSVAWLANGWALGVTIVFAGALLSLAAGWAWWRTTGTFMVYVDGAGRFLEKKSAPRASR